MDFLSNKIQKHQPKHDKKRLTQDQVSILEKSFVSDKRLEPQRKLQLANQLGVPPRQIAIWYQNRRARWKTRSLELDCGDLQLKLDNALAEKRKLEKDVERLKLELKKAKDMLKDKDPNVSTCCSTSCVEESAKGVSCLLGDTDALWGNCEVLQLEEIYACFMGTNRSSFIN